MKICKFILDVLAPKKCYICKKEEFFLCKKCLEKEKDFISVCYICKKNSNNFQLCENCKNDVYYDKVIISKNYKSSIISKLITQGKFYHKKEVFEDFGEDLYNKLIQNLKIKNKNDYIITNIPSTLKRKMARGEGSSELLCKEVSMISGIKFQKNVLIKIRNTKQQSTLTKEERHKNLKGAFQIKKSKINIIKDKKIIIIDDVISTGTTLNETSKILKNNGASDIIGLIIASGQ